MEDPFYADIPAVHCPNCGERYLRPEDLEVHRERHRPVSPRVTGSANCPKGCRRWLVPDTAETQTHLALCDGSSPLNGLSRAMDKRWFCKEHGFGTDGPKHWGIHLKEHHGGQDPTKPARKKPEDPNDKVGVERAVQVLREERKRLAQDLERVDSALKILETKQVAL